MHRHYTYNKGMSTLGEETCYHREVKRVKFSATYVMYDGVEEYTLEGVVCVECGLMLEGSPVEDTTAASMENNLLNLLRNE